MKRLQTWRHFGYLAVIPFFGVLHIINWDDCIHLYIADLNGDGLDDM